MPDNERLRDSLLSLLIYCESLLVDNLTLMPLVRPPLTEHGKDERSRARRQIERKIEPLFLYLHSLAQRADWGQFHTKLVSVLDTLRGETPQQPEP